MRKICQLLGLILLCCYAAAILAGPMAERSDVQHFIDDLVKRDDFDRDKLTTLFSYVYSNDEVITKLNRPYETKPWYMYRDFFITPERIRKGALYWKEHEKILTATERQYGVPAKIIVAIIGVESLYGKNKGSYPVLSSLATLAFDNYRRNEFFKDELRQFLLLTREQSLKPLTIQGSYAGAIGLPQFMPSSYRQYAVDANQKGYADLIHDHQDAIVSVANYLAKHGWASGVPVVFRAAVKNDAYQTLLSKSLKPKFSQTDLKKHGIITAKPLGAGQRACFVKLQGENENEYWVGLQNFYVISTYNKSEQYVLAVSLLADKIAEAHAQN